MHCAASCGRPQDGGNRGLGQKQGEGQEGQEGQVGHRRDWRVIGGAGGSEEGREGQRRGGRARGGAGGVSTVEKPFKARLGNGVEGI